MAKPSDISLKHRLFLSTYQYRTVDWQPGSVLEQPLQEATISAVTTAGLYGSDQEPFDHSVKGGDFSFREISRTCDLSSLRIGQKSDSFDPSGLESDRNLVLPLDRLDELAEEGFIGEPSSVHLSFMGSITAPGRLIKKSAPKATQVLNDAGVDAVFLTPVWPMCHQSVGLIQSVMEREGLPTVSMSMLRHITEAVQPPRALFVDAPLGYPLVEPERPEVQKNVLQEAFELLQRPVDGMLLEEYDSGEETER